MILSPSAFTNFYGIQFNRDENQDLYGVVTTSSGMIPTLYSWLKEHGCACHYSDLVVFDPKLTALPNGECSVLPGDIKYIKSLLWVVDFPDSDTELLFKLTFSEYVFSP